jgi:hypothetical protein
VAEERIVQTRTHRERARGGDKSATAVTSTRSDVER